jgi:hypothetical protein
MSDRDDPHALRQATLSVLDMHDGLSLHREDTAARDITDRIARLRKRIEREQ